MRILAWNVRGGGRPGIGHVVRTAAPDVAVLSDCHPSHYIRIAGELRACGLDWVTGTNQADYTGLVIAARMPMQPGATSSTVLPGHWCHIRLPSVGLSVVGVYGPLYKKGVSRLVPAFWGELLESASQLTTTSAVLVGDLNTAISPTDTTSGLPLPASKDLRRLVVDGWRDAFREVHGNRSAYSYWDSRGAYRIDHAMLSPSAPPVQTADYLCELAGYTFGGWPRDPQTQVASDHAALVFDL